MSLVNDMLNDLERRRSEQPSRGVDLQWLTGQGTGPGRRPRKPLYAAVVVVAVILVVVVAWLYRPVFSAGGVEAVSSAPQPGVSSDAADSAPQLLGVSWSSRDGATELRVTLSDFTPYSVNRDSDGLILRFYGLDNQLDAGAIEPVDPVESVTVSRRGGDSVVALAIRGEFDFSDRVLDREAGRMALAIRPLPDTESASGRGESSASETSLAASERPRVKAPAPKPETPKPEMRTARPGAETSGSAGSEAQSTQPAADSDSGKPAASTAVAVAKSPAPAEPERQQLTVSQRDMRLARQAKQWLRAGDSQRVETELRAFLDQHPGAPRSSKVLASLWLSRGEYSRADEVLDAALGAAPGDIELRTLKARSLLAREDHAGAVDWLMQVKPDLDRHPQYYALLGFAARRNQQYQLSAQTYRGLVASDERRGDWWVGLGIALDAQGNTGAAKQAFQRAVASPQISAALKQYARQRLAAG